MKIKLPAQNHRDPLKWYKRFFLFSLALFIASLIFQGVVSNGSAVKGGELKDLSERKSGLEKEIARLEFDITVASSLAYLEERAQEKGFVVMTEPLAVINPASVAVAVSGR